ncbi:MAG: hypothetical protein ICV85_10830 [Tolypothrix sp. T3-bin4]|nr:hypothetical protein [Tolypothrix sp. Co-bin9]MBD0302644.1 hypothetical protein [Tolypothrix sp. T3-bin4]
MANEIPQTTLDALILFTKNGETQIAGRFIANLRTALRQHILINLPGYSFSSDMLEKEGLDYALSQVPLADFLNASPKDILAESCRKAVENGTLKPNVKRTTYRPVLTKFLDFLKAESWYEDLIKTSSGMYAPKTRYGDNIMNSNQGRRCLHHNSYKLAKDEITPKLVKQIEAFKTFCTAEFVPERQDKKMRMVTFNNHEGRIFSWLGWLKSIENYELAELDLKLLTDTTILKKFLSWGINERENTFGWGQGFGETALNIAKWLHCHQSKRPMYRDIEAVEEIRMMINQLAKRYAEQRKSNKKVKREEKEMTMEQCIEIVKYLRQCCAHRDSFGSQRSTLSIIRSWQRYLLIAILTYCPLRQRELREMELGRTLFRIPNGYRVILQPEDNKTGDERDFILSNVLPPQVVADIDEWLDVWHPKLKKATENLDEWLGLVRRREYKNKAELDAYLEKLTYKIQLAKQYQDNKTVEKLEKTISFIQVNIEALCPAQKNLNEKIFFISCGNSQMSGYGEPLDANGVVATVTRAVYTASLALKKSGHPLFKNIDPRKTNPHFFRNIAITHERRYGDPAKRKAFHKVIGNSEQIGDLHYNEMHPGEKTADAKDWWLGETLPGKNAIISQIKFLLSKLTKEEKQQLLMELIK